VQKIKVSRNRSVSWMAIPDVIYQAILLNKLGSLIKLVVINSSVYMLDTKILV